jgi:hypothetical protein
MILAPPPETVALVRRLYCEHVPVNDILAQAGIKLNILYRCLDGRFPDGTGIEPARIGRRRAGVRVRQRIGSRAALIQRMWRTAERQVEDIEDRLKVAGLQQAERESTARTLATVARTLRELTSVDDARKAHSPPAAEDDNDEAAPRNIDDLRRALAEKLEAFVAGHAGELPDDAG